MIFRLPDATDDSCAANTRAGRRLEYLMLGWNLTEAAVAIIAGHVASGIALIGIAGAATALAAAIPGAWWLRHITARAVRLWRPGRGEFARASNLTVRVAGAGDRIFLLSHGLVPSGDTFGFDFDRLQRTAGSLCPNY